MQSQRTHDGRALQKQRFHMLARVVQVLECGDVIRMLSIQAKGTRTKVGACIVAMMPTDQPSKKKHVIAKLATTQ